MNIKVKQFLSILLKVGPGLLGVIPGIPPVLVPAIIHGIEAAELLKNAKGKDKKAHVLALATDAVIALNAAKGETVLDLALTLQAVDNGIDATIATINLVQALPGHVDVPQ